MMVMKVVSTKNLTMNTTNNAREDSGLDFAPGTQNPDTLAELQLTRLGIMNHQWQQWNLGK